MQKLKMGDRVRVRSGSSSPYRSRSGIVEQELPEDSQGTWYMVRFKSRDMQTNIRFAERELEKLKS